MSDHKIKNAIAAVMALGLACAGNTAIADSKSTSPEMDMGGNIKGMEKCYGVVKAGMNDCGSANHNCAGEAKLDSAKNEWVNMPTGLCNKIVGGNTKSS